MCHQVLSPDTPSTLVLLSLLAGFVVALRARVAFIYVTLSVFCQEEQSISFFHLSVRTSLKGRDHPPPKPVVSLDHILIIVCF